MLCYAVLCCAMLCYAVLCCAMLCYAVLCYGICYARPLLHASLRGDAGELRAISDAMVKPLAALASSFDEVSAWHPY